VSDEDEAYKPVDMAYDILDGGPLGIQAGWFWEFRGGVWVPSEGKADQIVRNRLVRLVGNKYRTGHVPAVVDALGSMPEVYRITGEPTKGWINFANGMLNTDTLELVTPHGPELAGTVQYAVDWAPGETPFFDQWVSEVVPEDSRDYFLQVCGYLLVPGNPLQVAVFVKGPGANGKSTWFNMLEAIVGRHHVAHVSLQSMSDNRFAGADLFGKALNIVGDMGGGFIKNTDMFKAITGGDEIRSERKFAQPVDFTPWAVPVFAGNTVPTSNDHSYGFKRRWVHLAFPYTFTPTVGYSDRFKGELPGIAAKCVRAYLALKGLPWTVPDSALVLKGEFEQASDQVARFIAECYTRVPLPPVAAPLASPLPPARVERKTLYLAYLAWHGRQYTNGNPLQSPKFYERVEATGVQKGKIKGYVYFKGLVQKDDDSDG